MVPNQSASRALADGQAALAKGDFAAYGLVQDRLKSAIAAAIAAAIAESNFSKKSYFQEDLVLTVSAL